jgi:nucleoid DNA-binding protein
MYPKKASNIIKQTAEELDISQSKVDAVISFYYKELRKELSRIQDLRINVPTLGYFQIKSSKVPISIKNLEKKLENFETETFNEHHNRVRLEEKLEKLKRLNVKIEKFLSERKKVRNEQAKYYLEKQKTDNGGN